MLSKIKIFILIAALCAVSYMLGRADSRYHIIKEQAETRQYVQQQTVKILSKPNARRDTLLELMRKNKL